jgi:predicted transcriptional regulator
MDRSFPTGQADEELDVILNLLRQLQALPLVNSEPAGQW